MAGGGSNGYVGREKSWNYIIFSSYCSTILSGTVGEGEQFKCSNLQSNLSPPLSFRSLFMNLLGNFSLISHAAHLNRIPVCVSHWKILQMCCFWCLRLRSRPWSGPMRTMTWICWDSSGMIFKVSACCFFGIICTCTSKLSLFRFWCSIGVMEFFLFYGRCRRNALNWHTEPPYRGLV